MADYFAVSFKSAGFVKDSPDADSYTDWLAGEDLARMIAQKLSSLDGIRVDPQVDVMAERWNWLINLECKGVLMHLSIYEHLDGNHDWQIAAFKKYDLFYWLFRRAHLREAIEILRKSLKQIIENEEAIDAVKWEA